MSTTALLEEQRRVKEIARQIFGNEQKSTRWFTTPKERFGGRSPQQMSETTEGLQQVERLLLALREGYF
jgi:uncharacterized protein (DUF2384 family)